LVLHLVFGVISIQGLRRPKEQLMILQYYNPRDIYFLESQFSSMVGKLACHTLLNYPGNMVRIPWLIRVMSMETMPTLACLEHFNKWRMMQGIVTTWKNKEHHMNVTVAAL
jgi:hypothetical protein